MARPSTMPRDTEKKLLKLVRLGMTDAEIGLILGRAGSTIAKWRIRLFISKGSRRDWAARFRR